jgi:hypothetical protein
VFISFEDLNENKEERNKKDAAGVIKGKRRRVRRRNSAREADVDKAESQASVSDEMV